MREDPGIGESTLISGGLQREDTAAFSIVNGGPFDRALSWARVSDANKAFVPRRLLAAFLVAWLPLLLLSFFSGQALGGTHVPFLRDVDVHARLLLALPLLLIAEVAVHGRVQTAIQSFTDRGLVSDAQRGQLDAAIDAARSWLDSNWVEVFLVAIVFAFSLASVRFDLAGLGLGSWKGSLQDGEARLTIAGWWFMLISLPLFQLVLIRWYFRLIVWWRLLWQISRIEMKLQPLHADKAGGLGFLDELALAFVPFLMAMGVMMCGRVAERIEFAGADVMSFRIELMVAIVIVVLFVVGPMLMFTGSLARAKREGLGIHGALVARYVREFDQKWLGNGKAVGETVLGNDDFGALADLGTTYESMNSMLVVPFELRTVAALVAAVILPLLPLLLTMFSLAEILSKAAKLLM